MVEGGRYEGDEGRVDENRGRRKKMKIKCRNNEGSIFGAWWGNWVNEIVFLSIISPACAGLVYW